MKCISFLDEFARTFYLNGFHLHHWAMWEGFILVIGVGFFFVFTMLLHVVASKVSPVSRPEI